MNEFNPIIERYNPLAGSTIQETIKKAKERAKEKDCIVLLRFNGVDIFVCRSSDCDFLEKYYVYEMYAYKYKNAIRD